jgi:alpha-D-xyloside xylohydrolase
MLRALFIEFPEDPGSWLIDDEYMFGENLLVAPIFEANTTSRNVYLPPGKWIDYQTRKTYEGGWRNIEAGEIPIILLVRSGSAIPSIELAQSTAQMDWSNVKLAVFAADKEDARGMVCLPSDQNLRTVDVSAKEGAYRVKGDPMNGKAKLSIIN